jgi:hypothetical protein
MTIGLSIIYGLLALLTLIQALKGRPLLKLKNEATEIQ